MRVAPIAIALCFITAIAIAQDDPYATDPHQWSGATSVTLKLVGNRLQTFAYASIQWLPGESPFHYYFGQHCIDKDVSGRTPVCWDFNKYAGDGDVSLYGDVLALPGCSVAQLFANWGVAPSPILSTTRTAGPACYYPPSACLDTSGCTSDGGGNTCIPSELNDYCADLNQLPPGDPNPGGGSPIVIHLSRGQYQLAGVDDGVVFDIAASGTPVRIGWTALDSSDAFLALDRNGNGTIDNGAELFGNHTRYPNGRIAANGFDALRQYDLNGDGVLDRRDPIWNTLVLWTDRNHDGRSTRDEIVPLEQTAIAAIDLHYHWTGRHDQFGNELRYQGDLLVADGDSIRHQPVYDIYFAMR